MNNILFYVNKITYSKNNNLISLINKMECNTIILFVI